ncbi:AAA family ATPase [Candidatus Pelagibacter sp. HIMB1485]|uniref:AAA family ATPase n=1 Tax=Candidatus Pelagibacter sp. HIMB1485 TaxID=3415415 RepID=UPI003F87425C
MFKEIIKSIKKDIVGNDQNIKISLAAILSGGHILIEDLPGTGKTTFAKSITAALNLDFKRIQFTSDLLPSDILGFNFLKNDKFEVKKGPIFTNIVLADELNRASPKTQSAFLEAMEEKSVTIDRETFTLPDPFIVIATQNPSDLSGTSLLPESQLDRFMISFSLDELSDQQQLTLLKNENNLDIKRNNQFDFKDLSSLQEININDNVYKYIQEVKQFLNSNFSEVHISSRCLKQIVAISKSLAILNEKDYVTIQDVKDIIPYVLKHRINTIEKKYVVNFIDQEILKKINISDDF